MEAFGAVGRVVDAKVPTDRETGRPRGFAFVELESDEVAEKCIQQMNGRDLKGRAIRVNAAEDRPPRPAGAGGGFSPRPGGGVVAAARRRRLSRPVAAVVVVAASRGRGYCDPAAATARAGRAGAAAASRRRAATTAALQAGLRRARAQAEPQASATIPPTRRRRLLGGRAGPRRNDGRRLPERDTTTRHDPRPSMRPSSPRAVDGPAAQILTARAHTPPGVHGSAAAQRGAVTGALACVTVTLVDGLVLARRPSTTDQLQERWSGPAPRSDPDEKSRTLDAIVEHRAGTPRRGADRERKGAGCLVPAR